MKKCPRCGYDVENHDKFCPHCGYDLGNKHGLPLRQRKFSIFPYLLIIMSFITIPLLYSYVFDGIVSPMNPWTSSSVEKGMLPEKIEVNPTAILEQYDTLADFQKQYSNVDEYIKEVENYEKSLNEKGNYIFNKNYIIQVYDNYDVAFRLTYQTQISNQYDLKIVKTYNRDKKTDDEKMTFIKKDLKVFEELLLTDQEKEIVNAFIENEKALDNVLTDFSKRKEDFENKKETLGHYGLGTYHENISYVVERYDDIYQVKLTYMK